MRRCASHSECIMESAIESVPLGVRQALSLGCGKKPSFNANDCHLESNASLITAHCLINVKCCVKKYIASL